MATQAEFQYVLSVLRKHRHLDDEAVGYGEKKYALKHDTYMSAIDFLKALVETQRPKVHDHLYDGESLVAFEYSGFKFVFRVLCMGQHSYQLLADCDDPIRWDKAIVIDENDFNYPAES